MIFRNMELDFDLFDADDADAYEAAVARVQETAKGDKGESFGDAIRRQCYAVFNFFDELFGDGFHKQLFGEKTNLYECLTAFRDFTSAVQEQKAGFDALLSELKTDAPAQQKRAARRAAATVTRVP